MQAYAYTTLYSVIHYGRAQCLHVQSLAVVVVACCYYSIPVQTLASTDLDVALHA
jgi:hypothetical protein